MMRQNTWRSAMGLAAAAMLAVCGVAAISPVPADPPTDAKPAEKIDLVKAEKRDLIIFNSGRTVEGVVIEETDASVKFLVIVGTLRSEATFSKSEILEIKRNEFKPSAEMKTDAKADISKAEESPIASASSPTDPSQYTDTDGKAIVPGTTRVYVVPLTGEFGRDVSRTPIKAVMDDLARAKPDVIVFLFNESFAYHQEESPADFLQVGSEGFITGSMVTTQEIDTLITPRLRDDPAFAHKPKVIAWVKKALGPAAFLPFVFHDIYFASDAYHGGVGGLDFMLAGRGDEVVRQKQRSLRLAWVKGLAEEGGHDMRIMKAMCWGDYILSYRIIGGQVELLEEKMPPSPEWFLLKDDGAVNKDHADSVQDLVRMKGNDYLTLDAKMAFDIGFSRGTADSLNELLGKMGITRNYAQLKGKSGAIFKEWSASVSKAEKDVEKLLRLLRGVQVKAPGQYEQRTAARGERIRYLQQIQSILKQYGESINPERVGDPDRSILQIDVTIDRIKTEQQLDRRP